METYRNTGGDQTYRSEIDGLRAIAVLGVVIYHFNAAWLPFGYLGVDVFFVISGYLISRILIKEVADGQFSFLAFYARRIKRILPALLVVCLTSLVAGYFLLIPSDLKGLGWQAVYAAFGVSNFYFINNVGYFDRGAEFMPLLHTWSLAVEEQFYVFWPLLIFLTFKVRHHSTVLFAALCVVICMLSLGIFWYFYDEQNAVSFFMLPARAWQLALGGALAVLPTLRNPVVSGAASVLGLALVIGAYLGFGNLLMNGLFLHVIATGGAAIVLASAPGNVVASGLSIGGLTYVGKISYSLYLWHWPILVFHRIWASGHQVKLFEVVLLAALMFALAVLNYHFVENPLRRNRGGGNGRTIFVGLVAMSCLAVVGFSSVLTNGHMQRLSATGQKIAATGIQTSLPSGSDICNIHSKKKLADIMCLSDETDRKKVLIFGDSHAGHLVQAFWEANPDIQFYRAVVSGCRPVVASEGRANCVGYIDLILEEVIPKQQFDMVIISARWRNGQHAKIVETVRQISNYTPDIVILGQTMEYPIPLPELLLSEHFPRKKTLIEGSDPDKRIQRLFEIDQEMLALISELPARYFSVISELCRDPNSCVRTTPDGVPIAWDYGHFTLDGAHFVVDALAESGLNL